jgi:hypothetical protein
MPTDGAAGDATVANNNANRSNATDPSDNGAGDAGDAKRTAVDDELTYTLTATQALQMFAHAGRKVPALRSVQRYCQDELVRARRTRTPFGVEWLINEASLKAYIDEQPIVLVSDGGVAREVEPDKPPAVPAARTSNAGAAGDANGVDIFGHPYVKRLEGEVTEYKGLYLAQVKRTEEIQLESTHKILALTQQVLIASSKNLGDYLLESVGIKSRPIAARMDDGNGESGVKAA